MKKELKITKIVGEDGSLYEGEVKDGKMNGYGKLIFS